MSFSSDLSKIIDFFADSVSQDNEHGHGHLHIALLRIVAQHLPHDRAEEAGGQVGAEQRLGNGDEGEGLDGRQAHDLGLVATDMRGVGLVLLQVLRGRWVIHDLVAELEGLLRQNVLLLLC